MKKMKTFRNFIFNIKIKEKRTTIIEFKIIHFRYLKSYLMLRESTF